MTLYLVAARGNLTVTRGTYSGAGLSIALEGDFRAWVEKNASDYAASGAREPAQYATPDAAWVLQVYPRRPKGFRFTLWPADKPLPEVGNAQED